MYKNPFYPPASNTFLFFRMVFFLVKFFFIFSPFFPALVFFFQCPKKNSPSNGSNSGKWTRETAAKGVLLGLYQQGNSPPFFFLFRGMWKKHSQAGAAKRGIWCSPIPLYTSFSLALFVPGEVFFSFDSVGLGGKRGGKACGVNRWVGKIKKGSWGRGAGEIYSKRNRKKISLIHVFVSVGKDFCVSEGFTSTYPPLLPSPSPPT